MICVEMYSKSVLSLEIVDLRWNDDAHITEDPFANKHTNNVM